MSGNNKPKREYFTFTKTHRRKELMNKIKDSSTFSNMDEAAIFEALLQYAASSPEQVNQSIVHNYLNEFEKINQLLDLILNFMKETSTEFKEIKREITEIKNKVGLFKKTNPIFNSEEPYKKGMDK